MKYLVTFKNTSGKDVSFSTVDGDVADPKFILAGLATGRMKITQSSVVIKDVEKLFYYSESETWMLEEI